jgi:hypothetical protein
MSVNKYLPHVFVLPEDDANREMANGFQLETDNIRQLQMLEVAGGWNEVLHLFTSVHVKAMDDCPARFMVLLIDFDDDHERRLDRVKKLIPNQLTDRVFVLGARTEPEDLRRDIGTSCEQIGGSLARDCRNGTDSTWSHALLRHNAGEISRLRQHVRSILFR